MPDYLRHVPATYFKRLYLMEDMVTEGTFLAFYVSKSVDNAIIKLIIHAVL